MADANAENGDLDLIRDQARKALVALDAFDRIVMEYIQASGERIDRFGYEAVGRPSFVREIRKGRNFQRRTMRQALAYIQGQGGV